MGKAISNLVVLAIIGTAAYALWNWKFAGTGGSEAMAYAEKSCIDEIRSRYDTTTVRSNSVRENASGYVVRGSMTLARGNVAKVTCLTNEHGRVRDIFVQE
jgi:hypothetical protein